MASGATQTNVSQINDYPNWAAVLQYMSTVNIKATVAPNCADAANLIQWTNGAAVAGDNSQRTVDKGTSAMTSVQAVVGTAPTQGVNIWIIWATVTIQITGNLANDNDAEYLENNGVNWPASYGGGNGLGAIDHDAVPSLTYAYTIGKIQATGTLTPPGIGKIVSESATSTTVWRIGRTLEVVAWDNGGHYTNRNDNTTWAAGPSIQKVAGTDDSSLLDWSDLDPSSGGSVDTIYDTDPPGCSCILSGTTIYHTSEVYANFTQFVTVTLDAETTCSDNAIWSYQARVDADQPVGSRIGLNQLGTSSITIPNAPFYAKR